MPIILYLTTDCNLECEYCYEAKNRKKLTNRLDIDLDVAKKQLYDNYISQKNGNCVVLFGGEPFLNYNAMKEIFDYNDNCLNNYYCFSINTNGLLIDENIIDELKYYMSKTSISVIVSYDGVGTIRRRYHNGISAQNDILRQINFFETKKMPFGIGYTIHKGNYDKRVILRDIIDLLSRYKYITKFEISYFTAELEKIVGNVETYMYDITTKLATVYAIYGKPICCNKLLLNAKVNTNPICKLCNRCAVNDDRIYVANDSVIVKNKQENDGIFDLWKED